MIGKHIALLATIDYAAVRELFIARTRVEKGRIAASSALLAHGLVQVDADGNGMLQDGRSVIYAHGKAWALRPEVHAQRLAEAMEQARKRDAAIAEQQSQPTPPSQQPTACASLIDGQLCGGTLVRAAVCPRCALGRAGVAATLTCDVCGHVFAVMRGDS